MKYSYCARKPVPDREFGSVRVFVFKDETYQDLVDKCKMHVYPEAAHLDSAQFWLGDASGNRIKSGDLILMSDSDGSQKRVPWS